MAKYLMWSNVREEGLVLDHGFKDTAERAWMSLQVSLQMRGQVSLSHISVKQKAEDSFVYTPVTHFLQRVGDQMSETCEPTGDSPLPDRKCPQGQLL